MLWQDEAGSAVTPPPPPPPFLLLLEEPQPAATSASTTTPTKRSPQNGRCLTTSSSATMTRRRLAPCGQVSAYRPALASPLAAIGLRWPRAEVAEPVDAPDSKSGGRKAVWVRLPPSASSTGEPRGSPVSPLLLVSGKI